MRQKIVAGNWKCNTTLQEGIELAKAVDTLVASEGPKDVVVVLGTPFTHIVKVVETVDSNRIGKRCRAKLCRRSKRCFYRRSFSGYGKIYRCKLCNSWSLRKKGILWRNQRNFE
jgi:hypothetical protein